MRLWSRYPYPINPLLCVPVSAPPCLSVFAPVAPCYIAMQPQHSALLVAVVAVTVDALKPMAQRQSAPSSSTSTSTSYLGLVVSVTWY